MEVQIPKCLETGNNITCKRYVKIIVLTQENLKKGASLRKLLPSRKPAAAADVI